MPDNSHTDDERAEERVPSYNSYLDDVDSEDLELAHAFVEDMYTRYQKFIAAPTAETTDDVVKRILADEDVPQYARELVASRLAPPYVTPSLQMLGAVTCFFLAGYRNVRNYRGGAGLDDRQLVGLAYSAVSLGIATQRLDDGDMKWEQYWALGRMLSPVGDACMCRCPCVQAVREAKAHAQKGLGKASREEHNC